MMGHNKLHIKCQFNYHPFFDELLAKILINFQFDKVIHNKTFNNKLDMNFF